jgi:hypothetical protein
MIHPASKQEPHPRISGSPLHRAYLGDNTNANVGESLVGCSSFTANRIVVNEREPASDSPT